MSGYKKRRVKIVSGAIGIRLEYMYLVVTEQSKMRNALKA